MFVGGRDESIFKLSIGYTIDSTSLVQAKVAHSTCRSYCRRFTVGKMSCGKMVYSSAFGFHSTIFKSIRYVSIIHYVSSITYVSIIMYIIYCSNNYNVLSIYTISSLLCNTRLCVGTLIMTTSSATNKR